MTVEFLDEEGIHRANLGRREEPWQDEWRECLALVEVDLWIPKKIQRREPIDEEGWDVIMRRDQHFR